MNKYKVYVFDLSLKEEYPIIIKKNNINELCKWLNNLILKFDLEVLVAYLLDKHGGYINEVDFLPCEIATQFFITNYTARLLAYNMQMNGVIK